MIRKQLPPHGLRLAERFQYSATGFLEHALILPLRDERGAVCNLQGIDAGGVKRFLRGATVGYALVKIANAPWRKSDEAIECLAIGEGWASVSSYCRMHSAYKGVAAMSAGELPRVARLFREKFPSAEIVIVADQDPVGVRKAGEACVAVNGLLHAPGFRFTGITDWNDLACKARATG